jgi:FkbM family methyltransferase
MAPTPKLMSRIAHGLNRRSRSTIAQMYLNTRRSLAGNRTVWIDHHGVKLPYHGDGDVQELMYHLYGDEWWQNETASLKRYVPEGGTAVDIGANLGFMSGVLSRLTGAQGRVFSFEPSPSTYAKLLEVIVVNGFTNVTPYPMGCGNQEGTLTLYCPSSSGHASLRPMEESSESVYQHTVRIVRLDDFLGPQLDRLDFIKIDTEGYEDEVLAGAFGLLQRFKPIIYIELCSEYLVSSQKAVATLLDLGYSFNETPALMRASWGDNFFAFPPM